MATGRRRGLGAELVRSRGQVQRRFHQTKALSVRRTLICERRGIDGTKNVDAGLAAGRQVTERVPENGPDRSGRDRRRVSPVSYRFQTGLDWPRSRGPVAAELPKPH